MSAKNRSATLDYLVYLAVRLLICVIQSLPFTAACQLARVLGWLAYQVNRRHRAVALDNLRHAFPGRYSDAELDVLVRKVYHHFTLLVIEVLFLHRLVHLNNWRNFLHYRNMDDVIRVMQLIVSERPIIFATGHFGNWEMSLHVMGLLGVPIYAIARPLDNPYLDDYLRRYREITGQKILAKKGDFDQIQEVLASGGILGTLADQDAGSRGLFVEFFNRPASTHKAVALLAIEHNVPIVVMTAARLDRPLQYYGMVEDIIFPEEYAGRSDAVRAITQRYTSGLERMIRQFPEQYFWLHRRWKHQPPVRKSKAA